MSDPPAAAAPDEGVAPFQVDCPTCGRDLDAHETSFLAGPVAPARDTAFLLCRFKCEGCGTGFDRAFWPIEAAGLLARYEDLEAGYRACGGKQQAEEQTREPRGTTATAIGTGTARKHGSAASRVAEPSRN